MNTYEKIMNKFRNYLKEKDDFKDKSKLRDNIENKIIENPAHIGILVEPYQFEKNKPIYKNDKIILIPNLTMTDINNNNHYIYIKLGINYEDQVRGFRQFDKLQGYIKKNKLNDTGYLLMSDKKYKSIDDYLDKVYIHKSINRKYKY